MSNRKTGISGINSEDTPIKELAKETAEHPAILREMVTSPAGTTAAALLELENRGVRAAFMEAVMAADRRSKELSEQ